MLSTGRIAVLKPKSVASGFRVRFLLANEYGINGTEIRIPV
jgi:hypothetical protein